MGFCCVLGHHKLAVASTSHRQGDHLNLAPIDKQTASASQQSLVSGSRAACMQSHYPKGRAGQKHGEECSQPCHAAYLLLWLKHQQGRRDKLAPAGTGNQSQVIQQGKQKTNQWHPENNVHSSTPASRPQAF